MTELEKERLRKELSEAYEASRKEEKIVELPEEEDTAPLVFVLPEDTRVKRADRMSTLREGRHSSDAEEKKSRRAEKQKEKQKEKQERKAKKEEARAAAAEKKAQKAAEKAAAGPVRSEIKAESDREEKSGRRHKEPKTKAKHSAEEPGWSPGVTAALIAALIVMLLAGGAFAALRMMPKKPGFTKAYAAGTSKDVPVFTIGTQLEDGDGSSGSDGAETAVETGRLARGTEVARHMDTAEIDDVRYVRISEEIPDSEDEEDSSESDQDIYIRESDLASSPDDVVRETEVYVRTPVTVYADEDGPAIASFAAKSSMLRVEGYDRLNGDGTVNKYRISFTDAEGKTSEGYVYGKYVTDTQEKADAVYNGNGIADKVAKDNYVYDLHGGKASDLDYYPVERPEIKGREFLTYARAMYINCEAAVNYEPWVNLIKKSGCNAAVIDIKDGVLAYRSEVAKEMSPRSYKTAYASVDDYRKGVEAYKEAGAYTIGRIVVFNDPIYAKDHPENCIKYGDSTTWPSGFSRGVWEYNVRLAQEAVKEFGFDEIQFDYVRFPENSYEMSKSGKADFRNLYGEKKGQAIQNFCFYAADQIHDAGAYFSIDVFGESAYGYMTAYGQYWAGLSNVVDAISAMPYTDHMGIDGAWNDPYTTMKNWGKRAQKQQKKLEHPAVARTWITGYDTPHWSPEVRYGTEELKAQVKGLEDAGLTGGFIPWNALSSLDKYTQYKDVWKADE